MTLTPVRLGYALFTMVDPSRGHEVEYNRWYERDHRYSGCMVGPGWFTGSRWVATKALKDLRFPETGPVATKTEEGSYLAIYWVHEPDAEVADAWAQKQVGELYAADGVRADVQLAGLAGVTFVIVPAIGSMQERLDAGPL